jgi:Family of unknown function (DUF6328)
MQHEDAEEPARQETPAQRLDRNWNELLQELRVAQTGTQILAAFLFTVPFQQRFDRLSHGQLALYLACVGLAGLTTALIVAPAAWHRSAFREGRKASLTIAANGVARAGLACLALVVSGTVALVFWLSVSGEAAAGAASITIAVIGGGWFLPPLVLGRRRTDTPAGGASGRPR